jgi:hypothetical protein
MNLQQIYCFFKGFKGIQIGSHVNDWNLDADELQPFFAVSTLMLHSRDLTSGKVIVMKNLIF